MTVKLMPTRVDWSQRRQAICQPIGRCQAVRWPLLAGTLAGMRMGDADNLVAIKVYNIAQKSGELVTTALARRVVDELLTHPVDCDDDYCDAAATCRIGDVVNIAASWQRVVAAVPRRLAR